MQRSNRTHSRIVLVPHDPDWPRAFELSSAEIVAALGSNVLAIHHIGSTSISGLHAKPVIDMLAVVADVPALDQQSAVLQQLGYEVMGEFGIAGRRYFRRDDSAGRRTHHLHAFAQGSPHIRRHLSFRDYLRDHPRLAAQYGALKRRLAESHPVDMDAYAAGKDSFIRAIESRALEPDN